MASSTKELISRLLELQKEKLIQSQENGTLDERYLHQRISELQQDLSRSKTPVTPVLQQDLVSSRSSSKDARSRLPSSTGSNDTADDLPILAPKRLEQSLLASAAESSGESIALSSSNGSNRLAADSETAAGGGSNSGKQPQLSPMITLPHSIHGASMASLEPNINRQSLGLSMGHNMSYSSNGLIHHHHHHHHHQQQQSSFTSHRQRITSIRAVHHRYSVVAGPGSIASTGSGGGESVSEYTSNDSAALASSVNNSRDTIIAAGGTNTSPAVSVDMGDDPLVATTATATATASDQLLEFCLVEADWSSLSDPNRMLSPLVPACLQWRYPLDIEQATFNNTAAVTEQSFFFPSGVRLELLPAGVMEVRGRSHNDRRHIVPFSDRRGRPLYAVCLTVSMPYRHDCGPLRADPMALTSLIQLYHGQGAARCLQKAFRGYTARRKERAWRQLDMLFSDPSQQEAAVTTPIDRNSKKLYNGSVTSVSSTGNTGSKPAGFFTRLFRGNNNNNHNQVNAGAGTTVINHVATAATMSSEDEEIHEEAIAAVEGGEGSGAASPPSWGMTSTHGQPLDPSLTTQHTQTQTQTQTAQSQQSETMRKGRSYSFFRSSSSLTGTTATAAAVPVSLPPNIKSGSFHPDGTPIISDHQLLMLQQAAAQQEKEDNERAERRMRAKQRFSVQTSSTDNSSFLYDKVVVGQRCYCLISPLPEYPFLFQLLEAIAAAERKPFSRLDYYHTSNSNSEEEANEEQVVQQRRALFLSKAAVYMEEHYRRRRGLSVRDLATNFSLAQRPSSSHSLSLRRTSTASSSSSSHSTSRRLSHGESNRVLEKLLGRSTSGSDKFRNPSPPNSDSQQQAGSSNSSSNVAAGIISSDGMLTTFLSPTGTGATAAWLDEPPPPPPAAAAIAAVAAPSTSHPPPKPGTGTGIGHGRRVSIPLASTANTANTATVAAPPPAKYAVKVKDYASLLNKDLSSLLSTPEWTLAVLLTQLSAQTVFKIVNLLLMEKSLVIYGKHAGVVTAVTLGVIHLLEPFVWEGIFVPLVPDNARELFQAPVPLIIGTTSPPRLSDISSSAAVLHLNDDTALARFHNGGGMSHSVGIGSGGDSSSEAGPQLLSPASKQARLKEIEFLAWFVRLPEVSADMPVDEEIARRIDHTRRLLGQHLKSQLSVFFQLLPTANSYTPNGAQLRHLGEETVAVKNNVDRLLMLNLPEAIHGQLRVLLPAIKRHNFNLCHSGMLTDAASWKRFLRRNPVTNSEEFYPDNYLEPLRSKLEFQDAVVHTQLFVSFVDRVRREQVMLDKVREFIGHWIYFRVMIRRSAIRRAEKEKLLRRGSSSLGYSQLSRSGPPSGEKIGVGVVLPPPPPPRSSSR